jgi:hypothetical protein
VPVAVQEVDPGSFAHVTIHDPLDNYMKNVLKFKM